MTLTASDAPDLALAATVAAAAADALPAIRPLSVGGAQPGQVMSDADFPGALVAGLVGQPHARIGLLVGTDLVAALADGPTGPLSLASALQPAFDAAAATLGARSETAVATDAATLAHDLGATHTLVPLMDGGFAAAVLLTDDLLRMPDAVAASPTFVPDRGVMGSGLTGARGPAPRRGIDLLHGVDMELTVELGRTRMAVRDLLALAPGDVLELDRAAGSPADLLVNGRLIARGEVVVVDEDFGLRITEILDSSAG